MNKKLLPSQTVLAFVLFAVMALFCGQTAYSQTGNVYFPSNFIETWKRDNFNNTLTITSKTLTSSSQTFTWTLSSVSGNTYKMNNGKLDTTVTIKFDGGNLIISGDSGSGQDNWNGTWKIKPSTKVEGANLTAKLVWVLRNAQSNGDYTIELDKDESLSAQTLVFEGKTNVTLRITGGESERTITFNGGSISFEVKSGVTLVLGKGVTLCVDDNYKDFNILIEINKGASLIMNEGSKITNTELAVGCDGIFIMNGGEITDNKGVGVSVSKNGTFTMNGGKISGNSNNAVDCSGTFTMNDGEISGNKRGGVEEDGTFIMRGGKISGNSDYGVVVSHFTIYGGEISDNSGCGVGSYNFTMNGGKINNNSGTGVYVYETFTMNGGEISGNTTEKCGGGVYLEKGTFTMNGGVISNNTANGDGGGVYLYEKYYGYVVGYISGTFTMNDGAISGNTANSGGGVFIEKNGTFTMNGGAISSNTANSGGGVFGNFTMSKGEISGNTAGVSGGGVYGNFIMKGGTIYGYIEGDGKSNVVKNSSGVVQKNKGHAVFIDDARFRESAILPNNKPDPNKNGLAGGWGY